MNVFKAIQRWWKGLDKNNDGAVDAADAGAFVKNIADVNNDGVVNLADIKAAATIAKDAVVQIVDVNKDGIVNVADAKDAVVQIVDVNKDGIVNVADVKLATKKVKEKMVKTKAELDTMTKSGLQSYGAKVGVELDLSLTKRKMIEVLLQKRK
jgi:hypothetical protein